LTIWVPYFALEIICFASTVFLMYFINKVFLFRFPPVALFMVVILAVVVTVDETGLLALDTVVVLLAADTEPADNKAKQSSIKTIETFLNINSPFSEYK
jgi:hypothetical protein